MSNADAGMFVMYLLVGGFLAIVAYLVLDALRQG